VLGVDFFAPNFGGNTPLTHAVAFGRVDIVQWLRDLATEPMDDMMAAQLATDFVRWNTDLSENNRIRRK
jgi:ankyrin repeat protein